MSDERSGEGRRRSRLRWITLGEAIAIAALIISALGLWHEWNQRTESRPAEVVEKRPSIPLTLRGKADEDGQRLVIAPVEPSHALDSLTLTIAGAPPIELGSDGILRAGDLEALLKHRDEKREGTHSVPVQIAARYVEAGADKRRTGTYSLRYRWDGGGLFGGRSLHLLSLSR